MKTVQVFITPKRGVLDPQGKAIQSSLDLMGFGNIAEVHLGKFIEIKMENPQPNDIKKMCDKLLANTVIEDYHYEIIDSPRQ